MPSTVLFLLHRDKAFSREVGRRGRKPIWQGYGAQGEQVKKGSIQFSIAFLSRPASEFPLIQTPHCLFPPLLPASSSLGFPFTNY